MWGLRWGRYEPCSENQRHSFILAAVSLYCLGRVESQDKAGWRSWAKQRRAEMGEPDHATIARHVSEFLATAPPGWVVGYSAMPGEVDLSSVYARADLGPFAITRTNPAGLLTVHPADSATQRHSFGYLQPPSDAPRIPLTDLVVVLVPGLVFDRAGGRLGFGAGYYDRLLCRLDPGVLRVGIVRESMIVDRLVVEDHDVSMTHLASEVGVRSVHG